MKRQKGDYAEEKLFVAVSVLANGVSDLPSRFRDAWQHHIKLIFSPSHWPNEVLETTFNKLKEDVDFLAPTGKYDEIPSQEVAVFVDRILGLFLNLARHMAKSGD